MSQGKSPIEACARTLISAAMVARFRRINWVYLVQKIQHEFEKLEPTSHHAHVLGGLYITDSNETEPSCSSGLLYFQRTNSIHIYTGTRSLGVHRFDEQNKKFNKGVEWNAQLWYSQSPSGNVMVFVAPFKSDLGRIDEEQIIIGNFDGPDQISNRAIRKHFRLFFNYCQSTSQVSARNFRRYLYRQWLKLNDFRYRSAYAAKTVVLIERILMLMLAAAGVFAAFYFGGGGT